MVVGGASSRSGRRPGLHAPVGTARPRCGWRARPPASRPARCARPRREGERAGEHRPAGQPGAGATAISQRDRRPAASASARAARRSDRSTSAGRRPVHRPPRPGNRARAGPHLAAPGRQRSTAATRGRGGPRRSGHVLARAGIRAARLEPVALRSDADGVGVVEGRIAVAGEAEVDPASAAVDGRAPAGVGSHGDLPAAVRMSASSIAAGRSGPARAARGELVVPGAERVGRSYGWRRSIPLGVGVEAALTAGLAPSTTQPQGPLAPRSTSRRSGRRAARPAAERDDRALRDTRRRGATRAAGSPRGRRRRRSGARSGRSAPRRAAAGRARRCPRAARRGVRQVAALLQRHRLAVEPGRLRRRGADQQMGLDRGRRVRRRSRTCTRLRRRRRGPKCEELLRHPAARSEGLAVDRVLADAARGRPDRLLPPPLGSAPGAGQLVRGGRARPQRTRLRTSRGRGPAPSSSCSSAHASTGGSAGGASRSPHVVLERRLDLDLPGPSSGDRGAGPPRRRAVAAASPRPRPPDQQRAGPSSNGDPHAAHRPTGSAASRRPAARERLPQLRVAADTRRRRPRARAPSGRVEVEPILAPVETGSGSSVTVDLAGAREGGGDEQDDRVAVGRQQGRDVGARPGAVRPQRVGQLLRRPTCRAAPRSKRCAGLQAGASSSLSPAAVSGSGPTAISVPPASTNSTRRARRSPPRARRRPGRIDRRVALAAMRERAVATARGSDRVVVEDVEVAAEPVEHAGLGRRTRSCVPMMPW